jgi:hypothetical protein
VKLAEIVPVLQVAVGAVILVSGVGLLLLTKTNRLGRIIDRTRLLVRELRGCAPDERPLIEAQLEILGRRGRLLRTAIALTTCSMLFAATLVIVLFLATLLRVEAAVVLVALFVACMASLIAGLLWFLRDVDLSLRALQLEVEGYRAASRAGTG